MPSKKVIIVQLPWIKEFSHKLSDADERNLRLGFHKDKEKNF